MAYRGLANASRIYGDKPRHRRQMGWPAEKVELTYDTARGAGPAKPGRIVGDPIG